ncbi:MAG: hypothetical protein U0V74_05470 [Chitinophagales bacterium]
MKNVIFTLCLSIVALTTFAADIKVDKTGAISGSVTTISAAITAAADGDRIVIFSGGVIYNENLTINKSLTLLSATEGEYWFLTGQVKYVGANSREITVMGMHQFGSDSAVGTVGVGSRCIVNIVDCEINGYVIFNQDGYDVNILYNTIYAAAEIRYGKVIANQLGVQVNDNPMLGEIRVTGENVAYGQGDTCFIIANRTIKTDNYSINASLNFDNPNLRYFVANNSFKNGTFNSTGYTTTRTAVNINSCYMVDSASAFINNYLSAIETSVGCTGTSTYAAAQLKGIRVDNCVNNILRNRYGSSYGCGMLGMRGDYNYYDSYRLFPLNGIIDNNYWSSGYQVSIIYDQNTGKVTSGNGGIDAGKPGVNFMDIDLTRSDMGPYGGPYSQDQYWDTNNPQGGRARVFLLNMPASIYSLTTPVTIKANATHTK